MTKETIKVIISDLDGTLLNSNHTISDFTQTIFQELHRQNFLIIIATGRHHLDAFPLVEKLQIPLYLVTSNGARIHTPEKELMYAVNMDSDSVKSILSLNIDPDITTVLFKENFWQTNKVNEKLNSFQKKVTYHPQIVDFKEIEDFEAIKIFFTHDNHDKLLEVKKNILENHPNTFNHAFSLPICLEFMDKSVDKSVAISKILEKENIDFKNSVSFGDGFNDEKMLLSTGKAFIMENAPENFKKKLPHLEVISANYEDGVAKHLQKYLIDN